MRYEWQRRVVTSKTDVSRKGKKLYRFSPIDESSYQRKSSESRRKMLLKIPLCGRKPHRIPFLNLRHTCFAILTILALSNFFFRATDSLKICFWVGENDLRIAFSWYAIFAIIPSRFQLGTCKGKGRNRVCRKPRSLRLD